MFSPDPEALRCTAEAKKAITSLKTGQAELKIDGSRASVWTCMALLSHALDQYVTVNHGLPEFLISSESIPFIPSRAVHSAKVFANREDMLSVWPESGVVCEIGTAYGHFAKKIWEKTAPRRFHIVDISMSRLDRDYFDPLIEKGDVMLHEGSSHDMIPHFPDNYFDVAYIDGDHWYDVVAGDIYFMLPKVKAGGLLVFNDYSTWSPLEGIPYGVLFAVNQLLQDENFEVVGFALSPGGRCSPDGSVSPPGGYHDIAIRKLRD